jgi:hypothetical protein
MLLGGNVTKTIAGGIAKTSTFAKFPAIFMFGMLAAEVGASTWILLATYLELPVSTTHSIIGGVVGFALVFGGGNAVTWCVPTPRLRLRLRPGCGRAPAVASAGGASRLQPCEHQHPPSPAPPSSQLTLNHPSPAFDRPTCTQSLSLPRYTRTDSFPFIGGMVPVFVSWFLSPLLAALITLVLFLVIRTFVLRRKNSTSISYWVLPVLVFVTIFINIFFIITKGAKNLVSIPVEKGAWIAAIAGAAAAVVSSLILFPIIRKRVKSLDEAPTSKDAEAGGKHEDVETDQFQQKVRGPQSLRLQGPRMSRDDWAAARAGAGARQPALQQLACGFLGRRSQWRAREHGRGDCGLDARGQCVWRGQAAERALTLYIRQSPLSALNIADRRQPQAC